VFDFNVDCISCLIAFLPESVPAAIIQSAPHSFCPFPTVDRRETLNMPPNPQLRDAALVSASTKRSPCIC
jgi:hypothetical protein